MWRPDQVAKMTMPQILAIIEGESKPEGVYVPGGFEQIFEMLNEEAIANSGIP